MHKHFVPQQGAAGWQISNAPVLSMAAHQASLEIFDKVGMKALRKKSVQLTGYLEWLLNSTGSPKSDIKIITPTDKSHRGCQISLKTAKNGLKLFKKFTKARVIADWREPDVIRIAPIPLYNKFEEVWKFVQIVNG
jgi:kynureninase